MSQTLLKSGSHLSQNTCRRTISAKAPVNYVYLRLDVKDFYPSVHHATLMKVLRRKIRNRLFLQLIEGAIKTPTGSRNSNLDSITTGVPQGLSISNVLASIYMSDIDDMMNARSDLKYFRYVDDILIIATEDVAKEVSENLPKQILKRKKLKCHKVEEDGKSKISKVTDGIDYLGYHFSQQDIRVRKSSYRRVFSNLIKYFTSMKYKKNNSASIWRLNIRISGCIYNGKRIGWMFYFSQSKDIKQLKHLDYFVQSHCKKFLNAADRATIKRFTKAYYEIKFNFDKSKYFPNFDNFDADQMRAALKSLSHKSRGKLIDAMTTEELEEQFRKIIMREVSELERDMLDAIS